MLLIFLTASLPAQELFGFLKQTPPIEFGDQLSNSEMLTLISIMENRRWASQSSDLQSIANKIPMDSRFALYDKYKANANLFFLNIYGGVGSLFQGDYLTSLIVVSGMAAGMATNISAANLITDPTAKNVWMATGSAIAMGSILYGLVRPFFYADEQNVHLRKGLFPENG
jgi:hypothetical protein